MFISHLQAIVQQIVELWLLEYFHSVSNIIVRRAFQLETAVVANADLELSAENLKVLKGIGILRNLLYFRQRLWLWLGGNSSNGLFVAKSFTLGVTVTFGLSLFFLLFLLLLFFILRLILLSEQLAEP